MSFDPQTLTPNQRLVWDQFPNVNKARNGWWTNRLPAIMAWCQVESSFCPYAYRYEEHMNEGSYGLMQVLPTTAQMFGYDRYKEPTLFDPFTNLFYGCAYAEWGWNILNAHLGHMPSPVQWVSGYNEGYGKVLRNVPDPAYYHVWKHAYDYWYRRLTE